MMHPHMAKLLADARIDEMLATAERHRLRKLARRQRPRPTKAAACRRGQTPGLRPPIVDFSTTANVEADRDDQDRYVTV